MNLPDFTARSVKTNTIDARSIKLKSFRSLEVGRAAISRASNFLSCWLECNERALERSLPRESFLEGKRELEGSIDPL